QLVMFSIIAPMMIPGLVNLVPTYLILSALGLLDTYLGLILLYWVGALPVGVYILRGFFRTIPRELEEAAVVEGCSRVQVLLRIVLPISKPALVTVAMLAFLQAWNDFIVASIVTASVKMRTAQIFLYANIGDVEVNWGGLMAAALIVSLPVLLVYFFLQRSFVSGLTAWRSRARAVHGVARTAGGPTDADRFKSQDTSSRRARTVTPSWMADGRLSGCCPTRPSSVGWLRRGRSRRRLRKWEDCRGARFVPSVAPKHAHPDG